jgi:antitoxin component of MazEF toxin-antitoxin module
MIPSDSLVPSGKFDGDRHVHEPGDARLRRRPVGPALGTTQYSILKAYGRRRKFVIQQRMRKVGNSFVVTIPKDEVERLGLREGQLLGVEITPLEVRPVMRPEVREAFEASWERNEEGYRYLADR